MNIGIACSGLSRGGGGMERLARDIVECLVERGMDPMVITRRADPELPVVKRLRRLKRIWVGWLPGKLRDKYFSWRTAGIKRRERFDALVTCHRVEDADIPICGGNHHGYMRVLGKTPNAADRMFIAMEERQFRGARHVVAFSELMRRELEEFYGVEPKRITLLYPPVDSRKFFPLSREERDALRAGLGLEPDKRYFLFPSGAHERKGLPFLRRFFEKTDLPVELLVAGRDARDGRNVRSLGYLKDVEKYYQASDATIMASVYEPFGMVGVESVVCGTPAVLSRNMACCEAIRPPALFDFEPNDERGLEEAVRGVVAFDRYAHGDLRRFIIYDTGIDAYVDALLQLARTDA